MKTTDCEKLATHFFLQQQGWSDFILPISLLVGVFAYARLVKKSIDMKSLSIIIAVVIGTFAVLKVLSRLMIPATAHREFLERCHRCQMDPYCGGPRPLSVEDVLSYDGKKENFVEEPTGVDEEDEIDNAQPSPATLTTSTPEHVEEVEPKDDAVSAEEIEQFTNFAPYDESFPSGSFRQYTGNWDSPAMATSTGHDSYPQALTPGEMQDAQTPIDGPTIYNPQWATIANGQTQPVGFQAVPANSMCMMPHSKCEAKCSGDVAQNAECTMMVAPVPGPTWQPQTASVVQARLAAGQFVPSRCPLTK